MIAKRYARAAVLRNAIKRQAREAFRHVRPGLPAVDVILRLNMQANPSRLPGLAQRAEMRATWRKEIESLLSRIPRPDSHGTMEQAS